jgi:hypothetical protein
MVTYLLAWVGISLMLGLILGPCMSDDDYDEPERAAPNGNPHPIATLQRTL